MKNKHIGNDFEDFLREEGLLAEVQTIAIKRVIAWQLQEEMPLCLWASLQLLIPMALL